MMDTPGAEMGFLLSDSPSGHNKALVTGPQRDEGGVCFSVSIPDKRKCPTGRWPQSRGFSDTGKVPSVVVLFG